MRWRSSGTLQPVVGADPYTGSPLCFLRKVR